MLWSINLTRDPILLGAVNNDPTFGWLKCFSWLEAGFQVPCFVVGLWGLWNSEYFVCLLFLRLELME